MLSSGEGFAMHIALLELSADSGDLTMVSPANLLDSKQPKTMNFISQCPLDIQADRSSGQLELYI
jgi:hypothetical protein